MLVIYWKIPRWIVSNAMILDYLNTYFGYFKAANSFGSVSVYTVFKKTLNEGSKELEEDSWFIDTKMNLFL